MTTILGRDDELALIARLVDATPTPDVGGERAILMVGEPGIGKTTLLEEAIKRGRQQALAVLTARGSPAEQGLPCATLHQLVSPVLHRASTLPARQRAALDAAFGTGAAESAPDRLVLALATLTLLSDVSAPGLLVVVDDLQWADDASARVLEFIAARLEGERMTMLLAARPGVRHSGVAYREIGPIDVESADALLDRQGEIPAAQRRWVRDVAEGNPLALVELARASRTSGAAGPVPLTARLEQAFAARTDDLPRETHGLLVRAAAAGHDDLGTVPLRSLDTSAGARLEAWAPAERAGLVTVHPDGVHFRHPLVRSALYQATPLADRRRAHLDLAAALHDDPYRRAWHLAAAAVGPDEEVAAALEASADLVEERGGWNAAARALERSADLSPAPSDAARRLLRAARCAMYAGQGQWVEMLARRAGRTGLVPELATEAAVLRGWALAQSAQHSEAVFLLTRAAEDAMRAGATDVAVGALTPAAVAAYFGGSPEEFRLVRESLARVGTVTAPHLVWVAAAIDPVAATAATVAELARRLDEAGGPAGLDDTALNALSGAAWIVDETPLAVTLMRAFLDHLDTPVTTGVNALVANTLGAALLDAGRWDEASMVLASAVRIAEETGMEVVGRSALGAQAYLAAVRGEPEDARGLAARALAGVDPGTSRALGVRVRWSLGLAAMAEGDWERAHDMLRLLVENGAPAHAHLALYALPDLVLSAVRTDRAGEARAVADLLSARAAGGSARLRVLASHARALAGDDTQAEASFRAALGEEQGVRWPVERARVLADYGAWLRRRRRVVEAREHLSEAAETFARVGAGPLAAQTQGELRAAGVRAGAAEGEHRTALAGLTPQQRQIVLLAARGLTNREIGERLFLSPRTVGFHLYQVFPRLGVSSRTQLRDVVEQSEPVT